jgi:hypothetical protein
MSRYAQTVSGNRQRALADRQRHPEVSDRERDFWRRAVALERERLQRKACEPLDWDRVALH